MHRKHIFLAAALLTQVSTMVAQDIPMRNDTISRRERMLELLEPRYLSDAVSGCGWKSNWFIGARGGMSIFTGKPKGCGDLNDRISGAYQFDFGKWFTPTIGYRLSYLEGKIKDCNFDGQDFWSVKGDLMWNLTNTIYHVGTYPKWGIIPYIGCGVVHNSGNGYSSFAGSFGIDFKYQFTPRVAFNASIGDLMTFRDFDGCGEGVTKGFGQDNVFTATAGLTFTLGKAGWDPVIDAKPYMEQGMQLRKLARNLMDENEALRRAVNGRSAKEMRKILGIESVLDDMTTQNNGFPRNDYSGINSLRARMAAMGRGGLNAPTDIPMQASYDDPYLKAISEGRVCVGAPILFFFKIGTTKLTDRAQGANLEEIARVANKYDLLVKVTGAADAGTGTAGINTRLGEDRAELIGKMLQDLGVAQSNITLANRGGINDYPNPQSANRHSKVELYVKEGASITPVDGWDDIHNPGLSDEQLLKLFGMDAEEEEEEQPSIINGIDIFKEAEDPDTIPFDKGQSVDYRSFPIQLRTNMLTDVALLPNIGIDIKLPWNMGLNAWWMYGWWSKNSSHRYWRAYGGEVSVRKYLKEYDKGWHVGAYGQMFTYDVEFGGKGYIGRKWAWGAGLEGGYMLPTSKYFAIDFTLGAGYLQSKRDKYVPIDQCYVWQNRRTKKWWGIHKAEISLVWTPQIKTKKSVKEDVAL